MFSDAQDPTLTPQTAHNELSESELGDAILDKVAGGRIAFVQAEPEVVPAAPKPFQPHIYFDGGEDWDGAQGQAND